MKLLKIHKITYINKQKFGGAKEYLCSCGHKIVVPIYKTEIKCMYCGKGELK